MALIDIEEDLVDKALGLPPDPTNGLRSGALREAKTPQEIDLARGQGFQTEFEQSIDALNGSVSEEGAAGFERGEITDQNEFLIGTPSMDSIIPTETFESMIAEGSTETGPPKRFKDPRLRAAWESLEARKGRERESRAGRPSIGVGIKDPISGEVMDIRIPATLYSKGTRNPGLQKKVTELIEQG